MLFKKQYFWSASVAICIAQENASEWTGNIKLTFITLQSAVGIYLTNLHTEHVVHTHIISSWTLQSPPYDEIIRKNVCSRLNKWGHNFNRRPNGMDEICLKEWLAAPYDIPGWFSRDSYVEPGVDACAATALWWFHL